MKRTFALPSESLAYVQHDCRPELIKYKNRNTFYDASMLTRILKHTTSSLHSLYPTYLDAGMVRQPYEKPYSKMINEARISGETSLKHSDVIWPRALCCNLRDEVIVADTSANRLLVFNSDFLLKYEIGGERSSPSSNGANAFGTDATHMFDEPVDLALSDTNQLYVADKNNMRVVVLVSRKFKASLSISICGSSRNALGTASQQASLLLKPASLATASSTRFQQQQQQQLQQATQPALARVEYVYLKSIRLREKPLRVCCALDASMLAIVTHTTTVYLINTSHDQIVASMVLDMRAAALSSLKPSSDNALLLLNMRNVCLSRDGTQLVWLRASPGDDHLTLRCYVPKTTSDSARSIPTGSQRMSASTSATNTGRLDTQAPGMQLVSKCVLMRQYQSGVSMGQATLLKMVTGKSVLLFDAVNGNLLQYETTSGALIRVVLRAEDRLGHMLAYDFDASRMHLVSAEVEFAADNYKRDRERTALALERDKKSAMPPRLRTQADERQMRHKLSPYVFKLRSYMVHECGCHSQLRPAFGSGSSGGLGAGRRSNLSQASDININSNNNYYSTGSILNNHIDVSNFNIFDDDADADAVAAAAAAAIAAANMNNHTLF